MQLKVFQLNMWGGTHFPAIQDFLEKNNFDILCFQEVAGANTHCGNLHSEENQFKKLQKVLDATHHGELFADIIFTSDPVNSFEGNAIFYKKDLAFVLKKELPLYKGSVPFPSDATSFEEMPRSILQLTLSKENKTFDILTTHLAWAPTPIEQPHQREQNLTLIEYIKTLKKPWILTGDFNISPQQPTILDLEKYGRNLITEHNVDNTIDPFLHRAWERIKPGFAVDYIFVSPQVEVKEFKVLNDMHMSDHHGLIADIEV